MVTENSHYFDRCMYFANYIGRVVQSNEGQHILVGVFPTAYDWQRGVHPDGKPIVQVKPIFVGNIEYGVEYDFKEHSGASVKLKRDAMRVKQTYPEHLNLVLKHISSITMEDITDEPWDFCDDSTEVFDLFSSVPKGKDVPDEIMSKISFRDAKRLIAMGFAIPIDGVMPFKEMMINTWDPEIKKGDLPPIALSSKGFLELGENLLKASTNIMHKFRANKKTEDAINSGVHIKPSEEPDLALDDDLNLDDDLELEL